MITTTTLYPLVPCMTMLLPNIFQVSQRDLSCLGHRQSWTPGSMYRIGVRQSLHRQANYIASVQKELSKSIAEGRDIETNEHDPLRALT